MSVRVLVSGMFRGRCSEVFAEMLSAACGARGAWRARGRSRARPSAGRWTRTGGSGPRGNAPGRGGAGPGWPGGSGGPRAGRPPGGGVGGSGAGARGRRQRGRARGAPPPVPLALAVAVGAADFAGLAGYGLFGGLAHREYLRVTEELLRGLRGQGVEVHLRVMEAADYADYCDAFGLDPGTAAARVAYAGDPELAGEPFVYAGEPLAELVPLLLDDHRSRVRMSFACAVLLEAVGDGLAGQRRLVAVMEYVTLVYVALAEGAGEGFHLLTLRFHGPEDGEQLTAAAELCVEAGTLFPGGRDTEAFCVTLAAGVAVGGEGVLLLHGDVGPEGPPVRGWLLVRGRLRPMSAHEVFDELADTVGRGVPFPPGVLPRPGFPLPAFPGRAARAEGSADGASPGDRSSGDGSPGDGPVDGGSSDDGSSDDGSSGDPEGGGGPLA